MARLECGLVKSMSAYEARTGEIYCLRTVVAFVRAWLGKLES